MTHRGRLVLTLLSIVLGLLAPLALAVQDAPEPDGPVVVRIGEQLSPGTQSLLRRGIARAKERDVPLIVELDTPGGNIELMWSMARAIDRATREGTQVVAFIDRQALSAGALLAFACDVVYMAPQGVIGAAAPIVPGLVPGMMPSGVDEKFLSAFRAEFRTWAEKHNRPGGLAEGMVDRSVEVLWIERDGLRQVVTGPEWDDLRAAEENVTRLSTIADSETLVALTTEEALRYRMVDGKAESLDEVVRIKLGAPGRTIERVETTSSEELASFLSRIAPLLLLAGVAFLWMELQVPGIGVPSVLAGVCFALLLAGRYLTGLAGAEHFALIGLGIVLLLAEIFLISGTMWAGIAGGVCVVAGLIWSQLGPDIPLAMAFDRKLLIQAAFRTTLWTFLGLITSFGLTRFLPHTAVGKRFLASPEDTSETFASAVGERRGPDREAPARVGARGEALTALRPVGKVRLDEAGPHEFEATTEGPALDRGAAIRVVAIRTGRLVVEALSAEESASASHEPETA